MAIVIDLSGRVALVTGGVRGVGAGVSRALLDAGAEVVTCARHEPEHLPTAGGRTVHFRSVDVREVEAAQHLVSSVAEQFGRLDILVNNAGGAPYVEAATASPRFHSRVVDLNLLAPLVLAQSANAVMQKQDSGGSIIMISSVSSLRPSPNTAAYGAAKAALNSLAGSLAVEWAPLVRVNSLALGMVLTELAPQNYGGEAGIATVAATVPLGRLADPDEIGALCAFLASPLAGYISGAVIPVHGGGEDPAYKSALTALASEVPAGFSAGPA
ncbi:MAG TPA: SDR family oxidoreductase [Kineosporiaceae bacterium]|nr:SDR family oxidoreductase [Kineosporiaceae bacterium]